MKDVESPELEALICEPKINTQSNPLQDRDSSDNRPISEIASSLSSWNSRQGCVGMPLR